MSGCIFDCSCWHDEYTQAILSKYPRCNVTFVTAQDMSTSGFSVVLCMGDGGSAGGGGGGARRRWALLGGNLVMGEWWAQNMMHAAWRVVSMGMTKGDFFTLVMSCIMVMDVVAAARVIPQ